MAKVVKLQQEDYEWIENTKKNVAIVILFALTLGCMTAGVFYVTYAIGNSHSNIVQSLGE